MITEVFYVLLILLGIPAALVLGKMCKEEINAWKFRFFIISVISFILSGIILLTSIQSKILIAVSLLFMAVVTFTLYKM
ncbi:hypothetical protein J4456_04565 [Candidatus Pacearchaeota archaeon]|nr:hypothetical protein [Candidatus Pacearchaeota archaeon]